MIFQYSPNFNLYIVCFVGACLTLIATVSGVFRLRTHERLRFIEVKNTSEFCVSAIFFFFFKSFFAGMLRQTLPFLPPCIWTKFLRQEKCFVELFSKHLHFCFKSVLGKQSLIRNS